MGEEDSEIHRFTPTQMGQVEAKHEHIEMIKNALIGVVNDPNGTGPRARISGIKVAGKTGTSQVVKLEVLKAYKEEEEIPDQYRDHAWFVAVAPAEKPVLALAVLMEHGGSGGKAAAPIAREMIKKYFRKR